MIHKRDSKQFLLSVNYYLENVYVSQAISMGSLVGKFGRLVFCNPGGRSKYNNSEKKTETKYFLIMYQTSIYLLILAFHSLGGGRKSPPRLVARETFVNFARR